MSTTTPLGGTIPDNESAANKVADYKDYFINVLEPAIQALQPSLTAWTSFTPTVISTAGTLTTVAALGKYKRVGKTVFVRLKINITTNGSGSGQVSATLPATAANDAGWYQVISGVETGATGRQLVGYIGANMSTVIITFYDATYPGANGRELSMEGVYEAT